MRRKLSYETFNYSQVTRLVINDLKRRLKMKDSFPQLLVCARVCVMEIFEQLLNKTIYYLCLTR